ncbi:hypothetical protein [Paenibacillus apiarius]|uniref:hypothetical protein n=1 Tax=Paenibacillus apiarius TaxID=46240 RepID=UPI00197EF165|nr:hypothetical protein [Paenibacillus apiarius]MBN3525138.1 hypothetical protein [Paenibacillus apiarius]
MKKRMSIVTIVSLVLLLVFQASAFAADGSSLSTGPDMTAEQTHVTTDTVRVLHAEEEIIDQLTKAGPVGGIEYAEGHTVTAPVSLHDAAALQEASLPDSLRALAQPSNATVTTATYSGVIPKEGEAVHLYPIYVKPGDILQVQLDPPLSQQLNYDLYLYEFDMATGNLITTPIDYSVYGTYFNQYPNGMRTLSENVGAKNMTSSDKAYLVEVHAKQGGSINDPFYVTLATSTDYDAFETDENAFRAYSFTVAPGGSSLNNRSISSPIDNDWYVITVPENRNYDVMNFSLDSASAAKGYKVEVYGVLANNQMKLLSTTDNNVPLGTGSYYVRVYTTGQYDTSNYTLSIKPVLRADKIVIKGYNSGGGPNDYPSYRYGRYFRIINNTLTVNGVVATSDNYAVANAKVDVLWLNENWTEGSGNRTRTGTVYTNNSGEFSVTLSLPSSTASISEFLPGAINFTHYYDLSGVVVKVADRPHVSATDILYHFAYSLYGGRG